MNVRVPSWLVGYYAGLVVGFLLGLMWGIGR